MEDNIQTFIGKPFAFPVRLNEQSEAINVLRSIMDEISRDGKIDENEFFELTNWVSVNQSLEGTYPFNEISNQIESILSDGVIESRELIILEKLIEEWLDPVAHSQHDRIESLIDKHVVITGDFTFGGVNDVTDYIVKRGAVLDKSVTRKTELVVVGALGSKSWSTGNYGNKIKKALENKAKGQNIQIVTERDFFRETKNLRNN